MRKYKTVANVQRYRRPDGTLISTPVLTPDDPGIEYTREDRRFKKSAFNGSIALLRALQAAHG